MSDERNLGNDISVHGYATTVPDPSGRTIASGAAFQAQLQRELDDPIFKVKKLVATWKHEQIQRDGQLICAPKCHRCQIEKLLQEPRP